MRKLHFVTLLLACVTLNLVPISAQDDPCTQQAVAASYAAALEGGIDIQQWYERIYANSDCPEPIKIMARTLMEAYVSTETESGEAQPSPMPVDATNTMQASDPPPGFRLPQPGFYFYHNGNAVELARRVIDIFSPPIGLSVEEPSTSNTMPSILVSSSTASTFDLYTPRGGIGVRAAETLMGRRFLEVVPGSPAENAGIQSGETIWAVDGIEVGNSIDRAFELLPGPIGSTVDVMVLRGSQRPTFTITRVAIGWDEIVTDVQFWDDTTVIVRPLESLLPGVYCLREMTDTWCFRLLGETLEPSYTEYESLPGVRVRGTLQVVSGPILTSPFQRGTAIAHGYVEPGFADGWMFEGEAGQQTIIDLDSLEGQPLSVQLHNPNFEPIHSVEVGYDCVRLPQAGKYIIVIRTLGNSTSYDIGVGLNTGPLGCSNPQLDSNTLATEPASNSVSNQVAPQIITVPVLITTTQDPNVLPMVRIVTATPIPDSIEPTPRDIDSALQTTAAALPESCVLHTLAEGEFLGLVAEIYDVDVFTLIEINGLDANSARVLEVGDVLIVPLAGCPLTEQDVADLLGNGSEPSAVATLILPPTAVNAQVEIVRIISPGDITAEGIEIRNTGGVVDLTGWTLEDSDGNLFTFPEQRLFTNGLVTVYTRRGSSTPIALYWGRSEPVWREPDDFIILRDRQGNVQSTYRMR